VAIGLPAGPARAAAASALALLFSVICFKDADFRRSPLNMVAGIVVGLSAVGGRLVTGVLAGDEFNPVQLASITFVAPAGESLQYLMTFTGATVNFGIAVVVGVIVGSLLMDAGGVLALGCMIGQGITGMSTLSLGSMIAWLSIIGGGYLGIKYWNRVPSATPSGQRLLAADTRTQPHADVAVATRRPVPDFSSCRRERDNARPEYRWTELARRDILLPTTNARGQIAGEVQRKRITRRPRRHEFSRLLNT
jgi:Sulphur transport